jgi:hypothetical protein
MKLNEGLDYHDMKGQIDPVISVDEYTAKMGKDSEIVTLALVTNSKLAAKDLVAWLELGYDFVLDASVSEGELEPGKWVVFVEMKRRTNVPEKIMKILEDLQTLTDREASDYQIKVEKKKYAPDLEVLKKVIITNPKEYVETKEQDKEKEKELNEYREIAGLDRKRVYENIDQEIKEYISKAGL